MKLSQMMGFIIIFMFFVASAAFAYLANEWWKLTVLTPMANGSWISFKIVEFLLAFFASFVFAGSLVQFFLALTDGIFNPNIAVGSGARIQGGMSLAGTGMVLIAAIFTISAFSLIDFVAFNLPIILFVSLGSALGVSYLVSFLRGLFA
jgi:hypothetical protein